MLFRAKELMTYEEELEDTLSDMPSGPTNDGQVEEEIPTAWKTCMYHENSCFFIKPTQMSSKYNEDMLDGAKVVTHHYTQLH